MSNAVFGLARKGGRGVFKESRGRMYKETGGKGRGGGDKGSRLQVCVCCSVFTFNNIFRACNCAVTLVSIAWAAWQEYSKNG